MFHLKLAWFDWNYLNAKKEDQIQWEKRYNNLGKASSDTF